MTYKINLKKKAQKFINKQDKKQQLRLYKAIYNLPNGDIKQLKGYKETYRLRVGEYRIIFEWIENEIVIDVTDADNRGDIYKNYQKLFKLNKGGLLNGR